MVGQPELNQTAAPSLPTSLKLDTSSPEQTHIQKTVLLKSSDRGSGHGSSSSHTQQGPAIIASEQGSGLL
jgi:hypothetical protein